MVVHSSVIYSAVYVFSSVICKEDIENNLATLQTIPNPDRQHRCMQGEVVRNTNLCFKGSRGTIKTLHLDFKNQLHKYRSRII